MQNLEIWLTQWHMLLENKGVQPEDHVIIAPEYTINSIAAILSILKCGAVYIPLDLKAPKREKRRIIEKGKT